MFWLIVLIIFIALFIFFVSDGDDDFAVCLRNRAMSWEGTGNKYEYIVNKYDLKNKIEQLCPDLIFQGELCGPGINGNYLELKQPDWFVFNIWSITLHRYLSYSESIILYKNLELTDVPSIEGGYDFQYTMEQLIDMAPGKYPDTNRKREGIVIRPRDEEIYSPILGGRLSFKVIANDYALAEKD